MAARRAARGAQCRLHEGVLDHEGVWVEQLEPRWLGRLRRGGRLLLALLLLLRLRLRPCRLGRALDVLRCEEHAVQPHLGRHRLARVHPVEVPLRLVQAGEVDRGDEAHHGARRVLLDARARDVHPRPQQADLLAGGEAEVLGVVGLAEVVCLDVDRVTQHEAAAAHALLLGMVGRLHDLAPLGHASERDLERPQHDEAARRRGVQLLPRDLLEELDARGHLGAGHAYDLAELVDHRRAEAAPPQPVQTHEARVVPALVRVTVGVRVGVRVRAKVRAKARVRLRLRVRARLRVGARVRG